MYGPILDQAIRRFQSDHDLAVDGVVEPAGETLRALADELAPETPGRMLDPSAGPRVGRSVPVLLSGLAADRRPSAAKPRPAAPGSRGGGRASSSERPFPLLPAPALTRERRLEFEEKTGVGLRTTERGIAFVDPATGQAFAEMASEPAEELVRDWVWFADRVHLLWVLDRRDLTSEQKSDLLERLLADLESRTAGTEHREARIEEFRGALDAAMAALERGGTPDEVFPTVQQRVFPELFGIGRTGREILLDMTPGLGNARSAMHAYNDIARTREAIEDGDWGGAVENMVLALLDIAGMVPNAQAAKALAKAAAKGVPYGEAGVSAMKFRRFRRQADNLRHGVEPEKLFGQYLDDLPDGVRKRLLRETPLAFGRGGEAYLRELARSIDRGAGRPAPIKLRGPEFKRGVATRIHDLEMRPPLEVIAFDIKTKFAKFLGKPPPAPPRPIHYELKTGKTDRTTPQKRVDSRLNQDRELAERSGVREVRLLRAFPEQVPMRFVIEDARPRFARMVELKMLKPGEDETLIRAMKRNMQSGVDKVSLANYAFLVARIAATAGRNAGAPTDQPSGAGGPRFAEDPR
jgi:hypothetical protein